ncbi:fructokinase [Neiella marina]|uniref:Fructokinase n=1 Tax=Neiella marina TaxID=508461 RepID=A0A8J2U5G0_9GAMM|nr:fructokinase [Neiella marina]GGA78597.1 fructokinase [Neiella marina]
MTQQLRIGIDLGGTKIECIALSANTGQELWRRRVATPRGDYSATLKAITDLVADAESTLAICGTVGLGIPGTISGQTGRVKNANSTWLNGEDLQTDLEQRLKRPVRISNDANCFAVSEAVDGAGAGYDAVFGVILGTGVGAGIAIHQQAWGGHNGVGGEWGHNPLPWTTEQEQRLQQDCYCGRSGCIETWLAGPSFARVYQQMGGEPLTAPEVMKRVTHQEPLAQQAFEDYCQRLARSLAHVVNVLDPGIIVLGGGMSNVDAIYPKVNELLADWVFGQECVTPVVKNQHGDSSGVRGAAWLWNT